MTFTPDEQIGAIRRLKQRIESIAGITKRACQRSSVGFGFVKPALVEWVGDGEGSGLVGLAISTATREPDEDGAIVVVDRERLSYPPGLIGVDLERLLVVRPDRIDEALWCAEQAMRCRGVGITLFPVDRLRSLEGRRLKLAVEEGGGLGLLLRPWRARREACWADVRFLVRPLPGVAESRDRHCRIEVAYRRGDVPGETFEVSSNHATGRLHVVPELARSTTANRAS